MIHDSLEKRDDLQVMIQVIYYHKLTLQMTRAILSPRETATLPTPDLNQDSP